MNSIGPFRRHLAWSIFRRTNRYFTNILSFLVKFRLNHACVGKGCSDNMLIRYLAGSERILPINRLPAEEPCHQLRIHSPSIIYKSLD